MAQDAKLADEAQMRGKGPVAARSFVVVSGTDLVNLKYTHFIAENNETAFVRLSASPLCLFLSSLYLPLSFSYLL